MTDDLSALDNLRPEVREAINRTDMTVEMFDTLVTVNRDDYDIVRAELLRLQSTESRANEWQLRAEKAEAELLRLTDDCARLMDCINAQPPTRRSLIDRAERAEAELETAQNTIDAQQDTMGALKRKLALSEGELAALKARIANLPVEWRDDGKWHVSDHTCVVVEE